MSQRSHEQVLVLHSRPYSESSLIVQAFTQDHGLMAFLVRGSRRSNSQNRRVDWQMSAKLDVEFGGRGELKTIYRSDLLRPASTLVGEAYAMACYLSELTLRLVQPGDPDKLLFTTLDSGFTHLNDRIKARLNLRLMEQSLLQNLGVAVSFEHDIFGTEIVADEFYQLCTTEGFEVVSAATEGAFCGAQLLAIAHQEGLDAVAMKAWRLINYRLLQPHLGEQPLRSKALLARA